MTDALSEASSLEPMSASWRAAVRRRLLTWFAKSARDLPWRRDPRPYQVWVSEIMLQQTQVATVVDYFERFLSAFPTIESLAAADEKHLMRLWEGLGYYRRARSMHQAAREIVDQQGGVFPESLPQLLALPGIGRYTAGAILSISRDQRVPVLEGNTVRVYSRWVAMREDVSLPDSKRRLWQIAEQMLPRRGAGTFNQAAMELGALVCRPRDPQCGECPVRTLCGANRLGLQQEIPGKVTRMVYEDRTEFGIVVPIADAGSPGAAPSTAKGIPKKRVLLLRVPEGERWAGLWDFPRSTQRTDSDIHAAARTLSHRLGVAIRPSERLAIIRHAVTRFRITLHVHLAESIDASNLRLSPDDYALVDWDALESWPLSATGRKMASLDPLIAASGVR